MTVFITAVIGLVSVIAFEKREWINRFSFSPYRIKEYNEWYRFLTHAFFHADWIHLLVNLFVLYQFGMWVEKVFVSLHGLRGYFFFILLFFGGVAFSVLTTYKKYRNSYTYYGLGASGGVSAVLFSFILFQPLSPLCLYGLLCMPAILWGVAYLLYSYYMGRKQLDNINHDAHFWGALFGVFFTVLTYPPSFLIFFRGLLSW